MRTSDIPCRLLMADLRQQVVRPKGESVRKPHVVESGLHAEGWRGRGCTIFEKDRIIAKKTPVHERGVHALIRVDARIENGAYAEIAQNRIERRIPESTDTMLIHERVRGRWCEFIDD